MDIKEVFEKCNDGDFVIDNNNRKWKLDKGDLSCDCGYINNFYKLSHILNLDFKQVYDIDWSKVDVDTKILVSNDNIKWYRRYFAKYEYNKVFAFINGTTSFTDNARKSWQYAKLYKEDGEEEKNGN